MKYYNDELYDLIHSLSSAEKRYIVRNSGVYRGKPSNALILFRILCRAKKYDEETIRKSLKGKKATVNFHVARNYLFSQILKNLESFHADSGVDFQLRSAVNRIQILYDKLLFKQCKKLIIRTYLQAEKYEKHLVMLELMNWYEILRLRGMEFENVKEGTISTEANKSAKILSSYMNMLEYRTLNRKVMHLYKRFAWVRTPGELKEFADLYRNPLLSDERKAISLQAKTVYYNLRGIYFTEHDETEQAYEMQKSLVRLMERNPGLIRERPLHYIITLNNLMVYLSVLSQHEEIYPYLEKLERVPAGSEQIRMNIFVYSHNIRLSILLNMGDFAGAGKIIPSAEKGLRTFRGKTDPEYRLLLYNQIAYTYFGSGEYSLSLKWLNNIISSPDLHLREDLHCGIRIVNLILHFELGNTDILEYLVKSTYRFLSKRKRLFRFENIILNFIQKDIPRSVSSPGLKKAFAGLLVQLKEISGDHFERTAMMHFDFISWLESKIDNKPFVTIVKEKYILNKKNILLRNHQTE